MQPAGLDRVKAIFAEAMEKTSIDRQAFLDQACADDAQLRAEVEAFLSAAQRAEHFLASPTENAAAKTMAPEGAIREGPGARIGPYKLLQLIGEGGFGSVFMAEQEKPVRRQVALKLIKLGMDTKQVIARFEVERQALAMMEHPNIARVLDAGATESGRPYFVMELVRGIPILQYCDSQKLTTRQRIELFVQVCHAIQHAHQKGVIHRDIKPSNVLVADYDDHPVPKVIDFGIAKAIGQQLTEQTMFTAFGQVVGTIEYMSPEQAKLNQLDIDSRTDIYSLGVLLYELLTGQTPFDGDRLRSAALDEMLRIIREEEPPKPSTRLTASKSLRSIAANRHVEPARLSRLIRGELDWIVMKALEKDRNRRYETANGLAGDVELYLRDEPVRAGPPSATYRVGKFVRRNRGPVATATLLTAALICGTIVSTWQAVRATRAERVKARLLKESEDREKLSRFCVLAGERHYEEADALFGEISGLLKEPNAQIAEVLRVVGDWHAHTQRWQNAAAYFAPLMRMDLLKTTGGPPDWDLITLDYSRYAPILIELGDFAGYERLRQEKMDRFAATRKPTVASRVVKLSLLRPLDAKSMEALVPLRKVALLPASESEEGHDPTPWAKLSIALMEYRLGQDQMAVDRCRRIVDLGSRYQGAPPREAACHAILAMSLHRIGQTEAARSELSKARLSTEREFAQGLRTTTVAGGWWFDWLNARILLREATALIDPSSPDATTRPLRR